MKTPKHKPITNRTWAVMLALALVGQIAWAVENSCLTTFVYDMITPDPRPVAWMVAASANTATLTTRIMAPSAIAPRSRADGVRISYLVTFLGSFRRLSFRPLPTLKRHRLYVVLVVIADLIMTFSAQLPMTPPLTPGQWMPPHRIHAVGLRVC